MGRHANGVPSCAPNGVLQGRVQMKTTLLVLAAILSATAVQAAEIKVLASNGVKAALEELAPAFERETGHKLSITFDLAASIKRQIESGQAFDLAIITSAGI